MTEISLNVLRTGSSPSIPHPSHASTPPLPDHEDNNNGEINCICGYSDDDGFTIQCDKCDKWQHAICMRIGGPKDVPDKFSCIVCDPRPMDTKRAQEKQRKRREQETRSHKKKTTATAAKKRDVNGVA